MRVDKLEMQKEPPPPPSSSESSDGNNHSLSSENECNSDTSADSDFYEETSDTTTNSDTVEEIFRQESTLVVQLSETKVRVTLVKEDGQMIPVQMEAKFYSTPFYMALIQKKFFTFGASVLAYAKRAKTDTLVKQKFWSWDIGKLLLENFSSRRSRLFVVNDKIYNSTELLAGLYFSHLKSKAEKMLGMDNGIKNVVFCIPLWYGSLHRQRLRDSGKIAGFEHVSVLNAITIITYCHMLSKNLVRGTLKNYLTLSENSGNVDLAFYYCKAGKFMKMVACTGNLYVSEGNPMRNLIKKHYETIKRKSGNEVNVERARKYLLRSLLLELKQKLPEDITAIPFDVLVFCETQQWKYILEKEMGHIVTTYDHIGAPPIPNSDVSVPNDCAWSPPVLELEILRGDKVTDLCPFSVCRSDVIFGKWNVKLMKQDQETFTNSREIKAVTIYPTGRTTIHQKNVFDHVLPVGTVEIRRSLYYKYMKMEIHWTIGKEGNIDFKSIHACKENGEFERALVDKEEYCWTPVNLTKLEIEQFAKDLQEIVKSVFKTQSDLETKRENLWAMCQDMAEKIWFEKHKRNLGKTQKGVLRRRIDAILNLLRATHHHLLMDTLELDKLTKEMQVYSRKYFT